MMAATLIDPPAEAVAYAFMAFSVACKGTLANIVA
jgi:hypothetical protein